MALSKKIGDIERMKDGFSIRGRETTRLETFMDAAFAFAITMLVISVGEIPKNFSELILALKQIPSFLSSFFIIMLFWFGHRTWSRRYGLEDSWTIMFSIGLIFVLLVYIYPLRLMFSALFEWVSGGFFPSKFTLYARHELSGLFMIYGIGLFAMAGIMALLHLRAGLQKSVLDLSEIEAIRTDGDTVSWTVVSLTGLVAALIAWIMPPNIDLLGGLIYAILPIIIPLIGSYYKRKEKKLQQVD